MHGHVAWNTLTLLMHSFDNSNTHIYIYKYIYICDTYMYLVHMEIFELRLI